MNESVRRRRSIRRMGATALLVASLGAVTGALLTTSPGATTAAARTAARAPATVTGTQIKHVPDTLIVDSQVVTAKLVTPRIFTTGTQGFALAQVKGVTYPAVTRDGGGTWTTNGPALHLPAAQAPLVVTQAAASGKKIFCAFGGGQVVDASNDGGKHWWRAVLGDVTLACVANGNRLVAVSQVAGSGNTAKTIVYVSTDGGHHWRLNQKLGAY